MTATAQSRPYTAEEYLALEKTAEDRHEFVRGQRLVMPGEEKKANELCLNLLELLRAPLRAKGFRVFAQSVKVAAEEASVYRYPDLVVSTDADRKDEYIVFEPILLVEIASKRSYYTDRYEKLQEYRALPSLQAYLIVHQEKMAAELFVRQPGGWTEIVCQVPADIIDLPFFSLRVELSAVYAGIDMGEGDDA